MADRIWVMGTLPAAAARSLRCHLIGASTIRTSGLGCCDEGTILVGTDVSPTDVVELRQGIDGGRVRVRPVADAHGATWLVDLWMAGIDDVVPMRSPHDGEPLLGARIVPPEARASARAATADAVTCRAMDELERCRYLPSLKELAASVGVSPRTLRRRRASRTSLVADARRSGRRALRNYLLLAGLPLARIAAATGYANASALVVAVRTETGTPPRQWAARLAWRAAASESGDGRK